jgi:hypothetical protein
MSLRRLEICARGSRPSASRIATLAVLPRTKHQFANPADDGPACQVTASVLVMRIRVRRGGELASLSASPSESPRLNPKNAARHVTKTQIPVPHTSRNRIPRKLFKTIIGASSGSTHFSILHFAALRAARRCGRRELSRSINASAPVRAVGRWLKIAGGPGRRSCAGCCRRPSQRPEGPWAGRWCRSMRRIRFGWTACREFRRECLWGGRSSDD